MPAQEVLNLGRAITRLGLEDKFLANGELSRFPLADRGTIANEIIAEKLRLGRWQSVIKMMYGGLGKADALYEGDREELKASILKSAMENPGSGLEYPKGEIIDVLRRAGEADLLFRLATLMPNLKYGHFNEMVSSVDR